MGNGFAAGIIYARPVLAGFPPSEAELTFKRKFGRQPPPRRHVLRLGPQNWLVVLT
jgi:hypothetical protein